MGGRAVAFRVSHKVCSRASSNLLSDRFLGVDFDVNFNLMNSETAGDGIDDLEAWG